MIPASASLAALLVVARADAPPSPGAVSPAVAHLEVRAAPECTSRAELIARIQARAPRVRFVEGESAVSIRAEFKVARPGDVAGEIVATGLADKSWSRRLLASSCAEATDAVALVLAVSLDPSSAGDTRPRARSAPVPTSPNATGQASSPLPASVPRPDLPEDSDTRASAPDAAPPPVRREESTLDESPRKEPPAEMHEAVGRIGAHVGGQLVWGPAPAAMPGLVAQVMLGLDYDGVWAPALILGATHTWRGSFEERAGTAGFTLDAAGLDLCPLRLRATVLEARTCGSAYAGVLTSRGSDTLDQATHRRPFGAVGASAVVTLGLTSFLDLWVRFGTAWTLVQDSYAFGSDVFHQASRLTSHASLGMGFRL